jgi:hypothetical protein
MPMESNKVHILFVDEGLGPRSIAFAIELAGGVISSNLSSTANHQ